METEQHDAEAPATTAPTRPRLGRVGRMVTVAAVAAGFGIGATAVAGAATGSSGTSGSHPAAAGQPPAGSGQAGAACAPGQRPTAVGTVATLGDNTFTLKTRSGSTVTVDVTASTTYKDHGVSSPSFADVKVGSQVAVSGTETSGTVAATSVGIGLPPGRGGPDHGAPGEGGPPSNSSTGASGTSGSSGGSTAAGA